MTVTLGLPHPDPIAQLLAADPQADLEHARRVADLSVQLARALGDTLWLDELHRAACLHDLGKVRMHDVDALPRTLTPHERHVIEQHPDIGACLAQRELRETPRVVGYIRHHHERFDGRGYPGALAGECIPLGARIISVADTFDALISDRPYRSGWQHVEARGYLTAHAGTRFDPRVVRAFAHVEVPGVNVTRPPGRSRAG
ncbi:HD-GYP domain-containing protein [Deinococcus soli (ex Cha et al. 2016)]|uniref:HD-GYP domain-containing protein n=1 Tax=Deinococcus soli (ex Cha et al. 2016) TaxID=1309411 RepID=UPI00166CEE57|nr:HD domain-containing phosphohydrolase [Deinococcus soli (ex Cha et al. 2016)]GGB70697.1 hypothetical protein GCM10008019_28580 [Deinococcus soli (ex Cha et al. 2016)]